MKWLTFSFAGPLFLLRDSSCRPSRRMGDFSASKGYPLSGWMVHTRKMVSWRFIPQKPVKSEKEILRLTLYSRYNASIFGWNWASKCFFSSPTRVWIKWMLNENLQNSWKRTKTNKSWSGNEAYKEYKVRWYVVLTKTLKLPTDKI